jgi:anti-sigma factor RsiW
MTHSELELQIDAFLDGELAPEDAREVEVHLKECRACTDLRQGRAALSEAIRGNLPSWKAPAELRTRVRSALESEARDSISPRRLSVSRWTWLALAASLVLTALGSWRVAGDRARGDALADQVLASHVRSLMPGHLTDVVSSDQHTVKPWFNGRLDFSPPVYDFAGREFPLLGARLDYVGGRTVAALVYGRRKHLISVFLWPSRGTSSQVSSSGTRQGYHLLHWDGPDYAYWVVSDLGSVELGQFAQLLRQADSTTATTSTP